jgi:hypothetical protein
MNNKTKYEAVVDISNFTPSIKVECLMMPAYVLKNKNDKAFTKTIIK